MQPFLASNAVRLLAAGLFTGIPALAPAADRATAGNRSPAKVEPVTAPAEWRSIVSADDLRRELIGPAGHQLLLIDARARDEYAAGHIPGAINLPPGHWRTPSRKPAEGLSQDLFTRPDGTIDADRYAAVLSQAGVRNDHRVVVYGAHGGKADGTTPASVLLALGHDDVRYLDGNGLSEWKAAGGAISTAATVLPASSYVVRARDERSWTLQQVRDAVGKPGIVFLDVRTPAEFSGEDRRGNRHGGRIPGAVSLDHELLLDRVTRRVRPPAEVADLLSRAGVRPDAQVVLYCQTSTRTSVVELVLRDLGFERVAVYDASWQEYGNRDDTAIERGPGRDVASAAGGQ